MDYALFDILSSDYKDQNFHTIRDHLARLFNSRQGSLAHMPDYGLPDMTGIYQELPYSIDDLLNKIRKIIETYEPRLKMVEVIQIDKQDKDCVLQLKILGSTQQNKTIQFNTYFKSNGAIQLTS